MRQRGELLNKKETYGRQFLLLSGTLKERENIASRKVLVHNKRDVLSYSDSISLPILSFSSGVTRRAPAVLFSFPFKPTLDISNCLAISMDYKPKLVPGRECEPWN